MAHKLINGPQSRAKEGARNLPANRHQGCPTNVPKVALLKKETGRRRERRSERIKAEREGLRIGTWNVRTLKDKDFGFEENGRLWQVTNEMKRDRLNIMGVSETHWKGQGGIVSNDMRMVYSGGEVRKRGCNTILQGGSRKDNWDREN